MLKKWRPYRSEKLNDINIRIVGMKVLIQAFILLLIFVGGSAASITNVQLQWTIGYIGIVFILQLFYYVGRELVPIVKKYFGIEKKPPSTVINVETTQNRHYLKPSKHLKHDLILPKDIAKENPKAYW
jgi:hypothetical protein